MCVFREPQNMPANDVFSCRLKHTVRGGRDIGGWQPESKMSRLLKFYVINFRVKSSGNLSVVKKKKMIQLATHVELLTEYFCFIIFGTRVESVTL